jgi:hypothetical protein
MTTLMLLLSIAALASSTSKSESLPAVVSNGRFFYAPIVNGTQLRIWLDTDGDGFITTNAAQRLHLDVSGRRARFPTGSLIAAPLGDGGFLPVIEPDASDQIFNGIDAQFGASWFQDRIIRFDYRRKTLGLLGATPAAAGSLGRAPMTFPLGAGGDRIDGRQFPSVVVTVSGEKIPMSLDTAATIVLTSDVAARMHDGWGPVRATSFLRGDVMSKWHAAHPQWPYVSNGTPGVSLLCVPRALIGTFVASNVWFSTRPNDDVFEGEHVTGKVGPSAFPAATLTLDYPNAVAYFD